MRQDQGIIFYSAVHIHPFFIDMKKLLFNYFNSKGFSLTDSLSLKA